MRRIRTAIIGCGKVGQTHALALSKLDEAEFVAVCDARMPRAQTFANQYGVRAFDSVPEMLSRADVEAVTICTPHPLHEEPCVQAARAGVHVLIEKPMAASLEACDAMLEAADHHGIKLGVVSQRRLFEPVQRMKAAIDAGKIGTPLLGTFCMFSWRDQAYYESDPWRGKWDTEGGGVLVNQSPHMLDMLQWFMGEIDEVSGYWANLNHSYIEVEDTAVAMIRFKSGGLGNVVASLSQKPGIYTKVHVHGSSGASVGVQTDTGATFVTGMSGVSARVRVFDADGKADGELTLDMAEPVASPQQRISHLRVFGDDIVVRQRSDTQVFQVYDRTTGKLRRAVDIEFESLTVSYHSPVWIAGQSLPLSVAFRSAKVRPNATFGERKATMRQFFLEQC